MQNLFHGPNLRGELAPPPRRVQGGIDVPPRGPEVTRGRGGEGVCGSTPPKGIDLLQPSA